MLPNLIVVCHKYPPYASGGLAPYVQRSLRALRQERPDLPVVLFTMNYPDDFPRTTIDDAGLRIVRPAIPAWLKRRYLSAERVFDVTGRLWYGLTLLWFNLRVVAAVAREPRRRGALISVHDWQSTPAGILATLLLRLPVAYHIHNTEFTMTTQGRTRDPLGLIHLCERLMGRLARIVVVPTPELRELLATHGWDVSRVSVVPHGFENPAANRPGSKVDPDERKAQITRLRDDLGLSEQTPVLVFAGRLSEVKGTRTLITALPQVLLRHPQTRLLMLGVGFPGTDESAIVHRLIAEHGVADRVRVYDAYLPHEQVMLHYELADVCVFPSTFEPFGLVSVEAMSLGRPVLLGPGFSSIIAADQTGPVAYRTTQDSSPELAELLIWILDHPGAAEAMGERGRRHVRRSLSWQRATQELLGCYLTVLAGTGSETR